MINKETVLSFFREKTIRPLSYREIVSLMNLNHKEARVLKKTLRMMVRSGDIVITRKGLYGPAEDMNLATGYFDAHRDGYGFLIMEKPAERDVFIPRWATMGAMHGDRVLVRIENWQRREGRIIRILERAYTKIAGRFETDRIGFSVKPKDKTLNFDISISQKDRGGATNGDTVIAEIITYPSDRKQAAGRVIKIIGKPEEPRAEIESIIEEFGLPGRFPRTVREEAAMLINAMPVAASPKTRGRKDLRTLPTVTIDGERAKDFDDAVSVLLSQHGYTLFVHIADVSFYVDWNSATDLEARKRGTSIYFPDRVIPMLPKELSENLCSLKPKVERLAFTVELDFDRAGNRINTKFYPSLIISNERMTYTSVRKILIDNDIKEREKYGSLLRNFELMGELCSILRDKRLKRGSLDFDLPEPEVLFDLTGNPEAILLAERNYAHMIIEEFMIAANEAVAGYLEDLDIPTLYRIHEEPDPMRFEDILKTIGLITGAKQSLKPKDFPSILRHVKGKPGEETIHNLILKSLKQARYSPVNVGHFGLASQCYTHFTSPIRRYPDLVVHRILKEALLKSGLPENRVKELNTSLPDIAFHASRTERLADKAEREVIDAMRVWFMKDKVGEEFGAMVVNVTPYGLKVRLKDFFVEGFLHVSHMTDDFYQFNEKRLSLVGKHTKKVFSIGGHVRVRINRVDMEEREISLDMV